MASFQNITPIRLGQAVLGTTATLIYTTPVNTRTYLKQIDVANTTNASRDLDIYIVPALGTAGVGNAIVYTVAVAQHTTYQWRGVQIMNAGDMLYALCATATSLTLTASGGEAV
jgi:hypothetical protein